MNDQSGKEAMSIHQWEYKIEMYETIHYSNKDKQLSILNYLGAEGWQLVNTEAMHGSSTVYIFKRPIPQQNEH